MWGTSGRHSETKEEIPSLGQVTYRTTREVALGKYDGAAFDLGKATTIKIELPRVPSPFPSRKETLSELIFDAAT